MGWRRLVPHGIWLSVVRTMLISPLHESGDVWRAANKIKRNRHDNQTDDQRGRVNLWTLRDEQDKGLENKEGARAQASGSDQANKEFEGG